ncbi:DUF1465 family protein [Sphingomicrobium sediminis]|uniref:DUF1465 family protein n=1 Tax=Sphingomicrobium sediminis TaxID=2950949 RepID=A0A9X2EEP2_9SPHN|nr:DUF1465 family protein [Sphingomicrobium sediminis]MCM8556618.1 DUF1465 family protein [Sphingomicrobium sediminis]
MDETNLSGDSADTGVAITPRLVDALYTEAMVLADEARTYFDAAGRADRDALPPQARVGFACESLKVTTRIMHVVAWLLTQRAIDNGELGRPDDPAIERRLGNANPTDEEIVAQLPEEAQRLIRQSADLYDRVDRLDRGQHASEPVESPARALMGRLERDLFGSA